MMATIGIQLTAGTACGALAHEKLKKANIAHDTYHLATKFCFMSAAQLSMQRKLQSLSGHSAWLRFIVRQFIKLLKNFY